MNAPATEIFPIRPADSLVPLSGEERRRWLRSLQKKKSRDEEFFTRLVEAKASKKTTLAAFRPTSPR